MAIKNMQGTPAHIEYIYPKEKEKKSNCIYYEKIYVGVKNRNVFL